MATAARVLNTIGPPDLTLHCLTVELDQLTNPIKFGILLRVPQSILEVIQHNHHLGEFEALGKGKVSVNGTCFSLYVAVIPHVVQQLHIKKNIYIYNNMYAVLID